MLSWIASDIIGDLQFICWRSWDEIKETEKQIMKDIGWEEKSGYWRYFNKTVYKDVRVKVSGAGQTTAKTIASNTLSTVASNIGLDFIMDAASCAYYDEYEFVGTTGRDSRKQLRKLSYKEKIGKRMKNYDSKVVRSIASTLGAIAATAGYKKVKPDVEGWKAMAAGAIVKFVGGSLAARASTAAYNSLKENVISYIWAKEKIGEAKSGIDGVAINLL